MSKQILGVFTDLDEAIAACKKYTDTTGLYSRVVMQIVKGGSRSYVAYGYDEACRLNGYVPGITHTGLRILASAYLNATKLRVLLDAMARHPSAPPIVVEMEKEAMTEKKRITERVRDLISRHPIYRWCDIISAGRGGSLGESSALLFLGFIDPHEATTSGKAKKYWGFTPEGKLRSGAKSSFKPRLKGVGYFTAERIVMGRDGYYRCYSEDTRVLTRDGLKYFYELSQEDEIATLNEHGYLEYQKPIRIFCYDYDGEMVHFKNTHIDLLVTPNHRLAIINSKRDIVFVTAQEILNMIRISEMKKKRYQELYKVALQLSNGMSISEVSKELNIPVGTIEGWIYGKKPLGSMGHGSVFGGYAIRGKFKVPREFRWTGIDTKYITISNVRYKGHPGTILERVPTKLWMKFLGWYIAEGSCFRTKNNGYVVSLGCKSIEEYSDIVKKLGYKFSKVKFSAVPGVVFNSKQLYEYLKPLGNAKNKYIPKEIKELSPKYLSILLETLIKGDGSDNGKNVRYYTSSRRLAEDVAEISMKCGYWACIAQNSKTWEVRILKHRKNPSLPKPTVEYYKGRVWCIEVPNHIILVERNGKFAWCGNSLFDAKKEYYTSKGVTGAHRKAIYWLAALLVSHAQQIMREAEGYEVPRHRMYIPPKSRPDQTPDEQILEALRNGKVLG